MTLLEALKAIRDHGPTTPEQGICPSLKARGGEIERFADLVKQWPEFSGCVVYPVKHPYTTSGLGYLYGKPSEMWNPEHPYGAARLRLLNWCIERLEAEQNGT